MAWLGDLPYGIRPSNGDLFFHDGHHGADRWLFLEIKMPWEFPVSRGQGLLLVRLAHLPGWTVRILRGPGRSPAIGVVTERGILAQPIPTTLDYLDRAIHRWVDGETWQDQPAEREAA